MTNLAGKPPLGLKPDKPAKKPRGMRKVSPKRQAERQSPKGKEGLRYMMAVKQLPCWGCGSPPPNDAHHCNDMPPDGEPHAYVTLPHGTQRSDARDTIPLCPQGCHNFGPNSYHCGRDNFHTLHGPDYGFIPATRALVEAMLGEIDF